MTALTRPAIEYEADNRIDLAGILRAAYDHKAFIGAVTGLFGACGLAYAVMATPVYQASSMLQIEPKKSGLNGTPEVVLKPDSVSQATTEIELIRSRAVLGKAVEELKLYITAEPRRVPLLGGYLSRRHDPKHDGPLAAPFLGLGAYAWGGERIEVFQLEVPDEQLGQPLTLMAQEPGRFMLYDADDALLLSGAVGETSERNGFRIQVAELLARPGTEFRLMRDRPQTSALDYRKRLKVSEAGKDSGIVHLAIEDRDPQRANRILDEIGRLYVRQNVERSSAEAARRLEFLRSQVPLLRQELEKAEAALNAYQTSARSVDISIETKAVLDQIVALDTVISEHRLKKVEYDRLYTPEHPLYQTLMTKIGELEQQRAGLLKKVEVLPSTQQELLRLKRDMEVTTQTYTLVLNKAQEQDVIRAGTLGNVRVIDPAYARVDKPARPVRPLVVVIAVLLGLMVSAALLLLRQVFYRGLDTPMPIENLGLPVYATLPHSPRQQGLYRQRKGQLARPRLLALAEPEDLAVESLRSLRTSLKFAMLETRNKVLMISSPTAGVGKSFVSSNLAVVSAQAGQKVLLIDADMRRGHLHRLFGLAPRAGLSDILASGTGFPSSACRTELQNLQLLCAGQHAPNPSELLTHPNFAKLLKVASQFYDLIIVDTPPVLAVTDAVLVAQQAGTSLLVARCGQSTAAQMEAARRRLVQNGVLPRGAIFNGIKRKASTSAYDTGAYGYYSYPRKA